jgi:hypothetical protein
LIIEAEEKQSKIPHVFFGEVHEPAVPKVTDDVDDSADDDDDEGPTDLGVIAMLGFDPADEE